MARTNMLLLLQINACRAVPKAMCDERRTKAHARHHMIGEENESGKLFVIVDKASTYCNVMTSSLTLLPSQSARFIRDLTNHNAVRNFRYDGMTSFMLPNAFSAIEERIS